MKTKTLVENINGFIHFSAKFEDYVEGKHIIIRYSGQIVARVFTENPYSIQTTNYGFNNQMPIDKKEWLYNLLDEYARTPVDEREEEEKFIYRFPWRVAAFNTQYVKKSGGIILLDAASDVELKTDDDYHFTDKEVETLPKDAKELIDVCYDTRARVE